MKIAIQGHPTRGKEVISVLKSLGGKNTEGLEGTHETFYYIDDKNEIGDDHRNNFPSTYKLYTLEEFEKEFPFKVGDKVTFKDDDYPYTIKAFDIWSDGDIVCEFVENGLHYSINKIKPYKEMKEERNITLTLEKAKEWYKKGGELKEIALQAFNEKELNPLPRSWEEFCKQCNPIASWRYNVPIKYEALYKLEKLRDCWRQGNIPQGLKFKIRKVRNKYIVLYGEEDAFLSFCDKQTAEEFLRCFRDLIEQAEDLI